LASGLSKQPQISLEKGKRKEKAKKRQLSVDSLKEGEY